MKLIEKLKNALFEEEYVEIEEKKEPKKKEKPIAKKIILEDTKVKKETIKDNLITEEKKHESIESNPNKDFKFKAILEDDFIDLGEKKPKQPDREQKDKLPRKEEQNIMYNEINRKEKETYGPYNTKKDDPYKIKEYKGNLYEKKEERKEFKPSPIISPIYGVLDQNYTKEEVIPKKEIRIKSSSYLTRNIDVDSVRKKAYGNNDDIFEEELTSNKKEPIIELDKEDEVNEITEEDSLLDISTDNTPSVSKVTMGDAEEYFQDLGLEYNVDYKDISHEKATGRRSEHNNDDKIEESTGLEDNLFDLIDSMYDEREGD